MALLWQPSGDIRRRLTASSHALFPSWSWAGWIGGVQYWLGTRVLSRVNWKDVLTDGHFSSHDFRRPLAGRDNQFQWVESKPSEFSSIEDISYHDSGQPNMHFVHPIAPQPTRLLREHIRHSSNALQFCTLFVKLGVNGDHVSATGSIVVCYSLVDPTKERHQLCSLKIRNKDGVVVGAVHVPRPIAVTLTPGEHGFILLSRTRLFSDPTPEDELPSIQEELSSRATSALDDSSGIDDDDDVDEEDDEELGPLDQVEIDTSSFNIRKPWCLYNVMLIESQQGVSRRLGLGRMHIDAFAQASPVWKDIELI